MSSNHWTAREVLMGSLSNSELLIKKAALFLPLDVAASQRALEVLKRGCRRPPPRQRQLRFQVGRGGLGMP